MAQQIPDQIRIAGSILDVLQKVARNKRGLTVEQLQLLLHAQGLVVSEKDLVKVLVLLCEEGKVARRPLLDPRGGFCYNLPDQGPLFDRQLDRDEIEREGRDTLDLWQGDEAERERMTASIMWQIALGHALEERYAKLVREVAAELAEENPVDLILEIAEWVTDDLNRLASMAVAAKSGSQKEFKQIARELSFRRFKAERFFQRLLRLDGSIKGLKGILDLPTLKKMLSGARVTLDRDAAKARLRERIFGEKIIEIRPVHKDPPSAAVGTDASVGEIMVEHIPGSFIPPTPATLFISAAAMKVHVQPEPSGYWDYDLDPRELRSYGDLDAALEGLLIAPHLRREAITDFRHLRSAAMELRQYAEELRVVQQKAKWHPINRVPDLQLPPPITLLMRDGRIFPLVHRLEDYDGASAPDDVLYGEIVRREIGTFYKVFHNTAGDPSGLTYAGVVKSPEYSWLAMIAFWYLHARKGHRELADLFYRPPLNDQAVTHLLFWGIAESKRNQISHHPRSLFVTFRVLRRFSDIAFSRHPIPLSNESGTIDRTVNEDDTEDWDKYIEQHIKEANERYDQHKRGAPALSREEYTPFLNLCCRAGVVMFYGAPVRLYKATQDTTRGNQSHFFTPRWEIALDLRNNELGKEIDRHLDRLTAWLCKEDGLVCDEFHAAPGFEEVAEGVPLLVPDVVLEAHRAVIYGRDRHASDLQDTLQTLISDIRTGRLGSVKP